MKEPLVFLLLSCHFVYALCLDPSSWMEEKNNRMIEELDKVSDDKVKAQKIEDIFKPSLDIDLFTRKIVGRALWIQASEEEKQTLKNNLYSLMLKEYTMSVVKTVASKPEIYRIRKGDQDNTAVTVLYKTFRGKNLLAVFSMMCDDSEWKIYDITVGGLRLSDLQQAKYKNILSKQGVVGLNEYLNNQKVWS